MVTLIRPFTRIGPARIKKAGKRVGDTRTDAECSEMDRQGLQDKEEQDNQWEPNGKAQTHGANNDGECRKNIKPASREKVIGVPSQIMKDAFFVRIDL